MNAMQLLYYQAPLSALILLLIIPVFEPVTTTITIHWTAAVVVSDQHTNIPVWFY
jgi:solute carrier family 35 protein E3